jgi:hypothetical protein
MIRSNFTKLGPRLVPAAILLATLLGACSEPVTTTRTTTTTQQTTTQPAPAMPQ